LRSGITVTIMVVLAVFLWVFVNNSSPAESSISEVRDIDPQDLATFLSQGAPIILEFYTNSCPWCVRLLPELEKLQEEFGESIVVLKMNAEKYWEEARKYNIRGVPTLVVFDNDGHEQAILGGYRTYDDLVHVLRQLKVI
jgi:thioredoxin 1